MTRHSARTHSAATSPFRKYDPPFTADTLRRRDEQLDAIRVTDAADDFRTQADGCPHEDAA